MVVRSIHAVLLLLFAGAVCAQSKGTIHVAMPDRPAQRINASIAGKSGGRVKVNQLLGADRIVVNDTAHVMAYEFQMTYASVKTELKIEGNVLTNELKAYLGNLRAGQIIIFRNILCRDKNGLMFRVYDIRFEIMN